MTRSTGLNSTYKKLAVQWLNEALCSDNYRDSVVADSFRLRNRQLLVAAKRYWSCYSDNANMKLTTSEQTNCNNMRQQQAQHLKATLQKKNKKNATARKKSIAYAQCAHLPFPAFTLTQPEGKGKRVQSLMLYLAVYIKEHIFLHI